MKDAVNHPEHYSLPGLDIEAIDVIRSVLSTGGFEAYCQGNAIKYLIRAGRKDGNTMVQDMEKAQKYIGWAIEARKEAMDAIMGVADIAAHEKEQDGKEKEVSKAHPFTRTCPICGKEFGSHQPQAVYCSEECREEANRRRARERERRAAHSIEKVCPVCGKKFATGRSNKKYCSDECREEANREKAGKAVRKKRKQSSAAEKKGYTRTPEEEARLARKSREGYSKQQMEETLAMAGHVVLPEGA